MKLIHTLSASDVFGPEKTVVNECVALRAAGWDCQIVNFWDTDAIPLVAKVRAAGIPFHTIASRRKFDIGAIRGFAQLLCAHGRPLVHSHGYKADLYSLLGARLARAPVMTTVHGWTSENAKVRLYEKLQAFLWRYFDRVVCVSESYRALARLPVPIIQRVSTAAFVHDLETLFTTRWPTIAFTTDIANAPAVLLADPDQLTAALWAVLQNAAEALHATQAARVTLTIQALVDHTAMTTTDNGPGIPPENKDDIFRPFFTTKGEGTGVGLALARQIFRGHGGDLALASATAGVTRFEALIPSSATA